MAKRKVNKSQRELEAAIKRFPKVVRLQERRALEEKRFLKKTFGALLREIEKKKKIK